MSKKSAGLIMYRLRNGGIEVLLVHPGGPSGPAGMRDHGPYPRESFGTTRNHWMRRAGSSEKRSVLRQRVLSSSSNR